MSTQRLVRTVGTPREWSFKGNPGSPLTDPQTGQRWQANRCRFSSGFLKRYGRFDAISSLTVNCCQIPSTSLYESKSRMMVAICFTDS